MVLSMMLMLMLIGGIIGGQGGIVIALILALVINLGAYRFSDRIALGIAKSQAISERDDPELHSVVRDQARPSGLPMPKVYQIHTDPPYAFDTGRSPKSAVVADTEPGVAVSGPGP